MEKRVLGIVLSLLGVVGLVMAAVYFMNTRGSDRRLKEVVVYAILGAIIFFSGIGLIRSTKDKAT